MIRRTQQTRIPIDIANQMSQSFTSFTNSQGYSSIRLEQQSHKLRVPGSSPGGPTNQEG